MKTDSDDTDLRAVFGKLRADDERRVRAFRVPARPDVCRRLRPGVLATVFAAAVGICLIAVIVPKERSLPPVTAESIPFDALSDEITREFSIATVEAWKSPTRFLLNPDSTIATDFHPRP